MVKSGDDLPGQTSLGDWNVLKPSMLNTFVVKQFSHENFSPLRPCATAHLKMPRHYGQSP